MQAAPQSPEDVYASMITLMLSRLAQLEHAIFAHRAPNDGDEYTWLDVANIAQLYNRMEHAMEDM